MAGNEMNMYFLVFVAVTTLSGHISGRYISKPGSMNVRFEIHNAPKTDTLSKPDLYVSVQITAYVTYEMSSGCTRTTSHVQDSYHPVFPEVYTYNYGGPYETLFFIVYEKEPFLMADKKLGTARVGTRDLLEKNEARNMIYPIKPGDVLQGPNGNITWFYVYADNGTGTDHILKTKRGNHTILSLSCK